MERHGNGRMRDERCIKQIQDRKDTTPISVHNIFSFYESESSESESEEMDEVEIETLPMEQYLALARGNQRTETMRPEIREIYCPPSRTTKQLEEIHVFGQKEDETLYHTWERYNGLLFKFHTHDLNEYQKVSIFYKGLEILTRQMLDSRGLILGLTTTWALVSIQEMTYNYQKWHDRASIRGVGGSSSEGMAITTTKLDDLGRDIRRLKESVHAVQGRPMLATAHVRINVFGKKISLEVKGEKVMFNANEAGSENRPPMLNKENYVPWSSRLLRYAKSRPNGKLIHNSIINGPYVRRMIPEPGDPNRKVHVNETFHVQTDDELTKNELRQIEADDQAIQTILLGLPEDIYATIDSCETAQEIWLRVQQMMKVSDIGIQEKNAKLFNK
uniref:Uncharacterized protein n=1 Tax=Tanacetum cinerariifolium TaxID=118510 RepID=A0A6L2L917_TANCI|nr:hypothetical protein [Tanacetum cinerariifolium]